MAETSGERAESVFACEEASGLGEDLAARIGEGDVPGVAVEEADAEFAFQALDALRQRRLGHVQAGRGSAEVQFLGHGEEVPQVPEEVHEQG